MKRECVVFDFFGVICSEVAPIWLARYLPAARALEVKASLVAAADRGELSQAELFADLSNIAGVPAQRIEDEWFDCAEIDMRMIALLNRIAEQRRLALLTNAPSQFVRTLLRRVDIERLFEVVFVSSERRIAKPDRRCYEAILRDLSIDAHQAVLVDDNPANVAGALDVGMHALLFASYEQIESDLTLLLS